MTKKPIILENLKIKPKTEICFSLCPEFYVQIFSVDMNDCPNYVMNIIINFNFQIVRRIH